MEKQNKTVVEEIEKDMQLLISRHITMLIGKVSRLFKHTNIFVRGKWIIQKAISLSMSRDISTRDNLLET